MRAKVAQQKQWVKKATKFHPLSKTNERSHFSGKVNRRKKNCLKDLRNLAIKSATAKEPSQSPRRIWPSHVSVNSRYHGTCSDKALIGHESFMSETQSGFKVKAIFMFSEFFFPIFKVTSMNIIISNLKFSNRLKGNLSPPLKCDVNSFIVKLGCEKWLKVVHEKALFYDRDNWTHTEESISWKWFRKFIMKVCHYINLERK